MSLGWSEVRRSQAQEILEAFFHGNFGFLQTSCGKTKGVCDKVWSCPDEIRGNFSLNIRGDNWLSGLVSEVEQMIISSQNCVSDILKPRVY